MNKLKICAVQPENWVGKVDENIASADRMIRRAAAEFRPDLVVLPENFMLWGPKQAIQYDESIVTGFLSAIARETGVYLVGGSFHRLDKFTGKYFNTCYIYDRFGTPIGEYHKRKLFHRELKYKVNPGDKPLVIDIEGWKTGILICADLWYPELCREMVDTADIIAVPAQSVVRGKEYQPYAHRLWHSLALTRSQENSLLVVVADHPLLDRQPYAGGGTAICDPSASMEAEGIKQIQLVIEKGEPGYLRWTADKERLTQFREYRRERGLLPNIGNSENG